MRVLVFGASSVQGYWDAQGGWSDRLKHYYDELQMQDWSQEQPRIINLGVSGDTSNQVLSRVSSEAAGRQNEKGLAIIIQVGGNNAAEENGKTLTTAEEYQAELEKIVDESRKFTDKVLAIGFQRVDESKTLPVAWKDLYYKNNNMARFELAAKERTEKLDVPFVPIFEKFQTDMNAHDGLHPNDKGHQLIFELVRPELDKLLNS